MIRNEKAMSLSDDLFSQGAQAGRDLTAQLSRELMDKKNAELMRLRAENTRLRMALTAIMEDAEGINPELRALGFIPCVIMKSNLALGNAALKPQPPAHLEKSP